MMDITDKESYRSLYSELKQYEKRGIDILMDGYQVSPMQIVTAYMAKEEGAYMRDYVMDQNGRLESLTFTDVDELNVDKFGLSVLTPRCRTVQIDEQSEKRKVRKGCINVRKVYSEKV